MRRLALLLVLAATPAMAATKAKQAEYGSWFGSASYFQFEGTDGAAERGCRALHYDLSDRYGFGLGVGYQFASGWSLEASWLRLREDVNVNSAHWGQVSDGFIVTGKVPLRFLNRCCQ